MSWSGLRTIRGWNNCSCAGAGVVKTAHVVTGLRPVQRANWFSAQLANRAAFGRPNFLWSEPGRRVSTPLKPQGDPHNVVLHLDRPLRKPRFHIRLHVAD